MAKTKSFPEVAKTLFIYGSFSKPFLNMALDTSRNSIWKRYFSCLKYEWRNDFPLALREIETGLKHVKQEREKNERFKSLLGFIDLRIKKYESGKTAYYLFTITKFSILTKLDDSQTDSLFLKLREEYSKMPKVVRQIAASVFLNYQSVSEKDERFKLRCRNMNQSTYVFVLLGKAREKAKNGDIPNGFSLFLKAFKIARGIPHSTGVVNSLNDMAWYTRNLHPHWSCEMAKRAVYWSGWYKEDMESIFFAIDTLFECQKSTSDFRIFENACLILSSTDYLSDSSKERYHLRIESCNGIVPDFKKSRYENSEILANYLKSNVKSVISAFRTTGIARDNISNILNGKAKSVRGYTLRKLIKGLNIKADLDTPFPIVNEYVKMRIEDEFTKAIDEFERFSSDEKIIMLLSTYMAYFERRKIIPLLSRKNILSQAIRLCKNDIKAFRDYMSRRYETMDFVNSMINAHPFVQARKDLVKAFLERMPKRTREKFIKVYTDSEERDKYIIDRFARDYIRYDIRWGMRVDVPNSMKKYTQAFHFKETPAALAYWALDTQKEREKLLEVLEKFE